MKVLHSETYEREGNDSWLVDKIQLIHEDGELILRHKKNHRGWAGTFKDTTEISLEEFDTLEEKEKRINEYIESEVSSHMKISNLKEILEFS